MAPGTDRALSTNEQRRCGSGQRRDELELLDLTRAGDDDLWDNDLRYEPLPPHRIGGPEPAAIDGADRASGLASSVLGDRYFVALAMANEPSRYRMIYGRRRGRKLRAAQAGLMATLLPRLRFIVPESGGFHPGLLFPGYRRIAIEIGFGAGEHLAAQAAAQAETGFIGVEIFETGVAKLLTAIAAQSLSNVRILIDDARLLLAALPEQCLDSAYILFPDPWPKLRHHKRRIVSPATLAQLARAMRDGGELRLATDDMDYLRAMLIDASQMPEWQWLARRPSDWRERPDDWPATRYEAKALATGRRPRFLRFIRRPRG